MVKLYFYKIDASYSSLSHTCATVECLLLDKEDVSNDKQEILSYKDGIHFKTQDNYGHIGDYR